MGGARAEYKLNIAGSVARRRREIFEIIHLGNMISLAKIMLLERFRNVPQAIFTPKPQNFPAFGRIFSQHVFASENPPLLEKGVEQGGGR